LTVLHRAIIGKKQAITNYLLRESANPFVLDDVSGQLMIFISCYDLPCASDTGSDPFGL
jgi:hypothetical protein